jgi:hypothetical protein
MFDSYVAVVSELQRGRGGRNAMTRKVGNNTYLHVPEGWQYGDAVYLKLHATDILTFTPDHVTYNSGGWQTSTTKERLNAYGPVRISQRSHVWYVSASYDPASGWRELGIYADGLRASYDGAEVSGLAEPSQVDADKALDRRIRAYAKLCGESLPLDDPSGGDCWGCYFRTDPSTGKPTVEPFGTDHYLEHMREGYVVPSLVWNATVARGYGNAGIVWHMHNVPRAADSVARDVRRYLRNRLGTIRSAEQSYANQGFAVR